MATDSIMGLFATPEQYQQAQYNQVLDRNIALAKLTPMQRNVAQLGTFSNQLGGAIGSALGAEDPMLKMASARQQILRGVNPQDMKSIEEAAIQFSRMGDGQGVQAMQDLALKQSQVIRNTREARAAANKIVEADGRQYLVNSVTGERIADLGAAPDKSTKVTVAPEIKLPADVNALISGYETAIKPQVDVYNQAGSARDLINIASKNNNPTAWESARTQVAKAVGESKLSNADIERIGVDPTIIGGLRDWIERKTVGVPDEKTQKALYSVATYIRNQAQERVTKQRNSRIAAAKGVNPNIDTTLAFPDYVTGTTNATSNQPASNGTIVDWNTFSSTKPAK